jgi:hypothetical protein
MRGPGASPGVRIFRAGVALLTGSLAARIAWTGEFRAKGADIVGALALMALVALCG